MGRSQEVDCVGAFLLEMFESLSFLEGSSFCTFVLISDSSFFSILCDFFFSSFNLSSNSANLTS